MALRRIERNSIEDTFDGARKTLDNGEILFTLGKSNPEPASAVASRSITADNATVDLERGGENGFDTQDSTNIGDWQSPADPSSVSMSASYGAVTFDFSANAGQGGKWRWEAPDEPTTPTDGSHDAPATITITLTDADGSSNVVFNLTRRYIPYLAMDVNGQAGGPAIYKLGSGNGTIADKKHFYFTDGVALDITCKWSDPSEGVAGSYTQTFEMLKLDDTAAFSSPSWSNNGATLPIGGGKKASITPSSADAGEYKVRLTNSEGGVSEDTFELIEGAAQVPPSIFANVGNYSANVTEGDDISFSGTWYDSDNAGSVTIEVIDGRGTLAHSAATGTSGTWTYTLNNVALSDAGNVHLRITDTDSNTADIHLPVQVAENPTQIPPGVEIWRWSPSDMTTVEYDNFVADNTKFYDVANSRRRSKYGDTATALLLDAVRNDRLHVNIPHLAPTFDGNKLRCFIKPGAADAHCQVVPIAGSSYNAGSYLVPQVLFRWTHRMFLPANVEWHNIPWCLVFQLHTGNPPGMTDKQPLMALYIQSGQFNFRCRGSADQVPTDYDYDVSHLHPLTPGLFYDVRIEWRVDPLGSTSTASCWLNGDLIDGLPYTQPLGINASGIGGNGDQRYWPSVGYYGHTGSSFEDPTNNFPVVDLYSAKLEVLEG